ncbi:MAG: HAD family hydrolase [Chloroflexota bacterium]
MTKLTINGRVFDIDMIVFDKDGTLIELDFLWGRQIEKWGYLIQSRLQLEDAFLHSMYEQMGYDFQNGRLIPDGPAAVATIDQFMAIGSFLIYRRGDVSWTEAEEAVIASAEQSVAFAPEPDMLKMIGDVIGVFENLRRRKIRIGVLTSDDRIPTEKTIDMLNWRPYIDAIGCGNDPIPGKPAPDGLLQISKEMNIPTSRMLMVGDSTGDMRAGKSAGVAGCIGVGQLGDGVTAVADVMIQSIEDILVLED